MSDEIKTKLQKLGFVFGNEAEYPALRITETVVLQVVAVSYMAVKVRLYDTQKRITIYAGEINTNILADSTLDFMNEASQYFRAVHDGIGQAMQDIVEAEKV